MSPSPHLLIFGLGYSGSAVAEAARGAGFSVTGTVRNTAVPPATMQYSAAPQDAALHGAAPCDAAPFDTAPYDAAEPILQAVTHVLTTIPPGPDGDPVLVRYAPAIAAAPRLHWIGYLSSTVVYGDRGGGWVDEDTPSAPTQDRGHARLAAENGWSAFADAHAVDVFRLAGIYGPGRSPFDGLRAGRAQRLLKPGHAFGRIHRDDIAGAVLAAMRQDRPVGRRILNLNDDEPAETAAILAEAAQLLGMPPPPAIPFAEAVHSMSPMARSFWAENRKVASRKTQATLGYAWRYPSYREGLRAILREERAQRPA